MAELEIYSDINLETPLTKLKLTNKEAVQQAVKTILTTFDGFRLFRPELYIQLDDLVFETMDDLTSFMVENLIISELENHEPRITVLDVQFDTDNERKLLGVTVTYSILGFDDQQQEKVRI